MITRQLLLRLLLVSLMWGCNPTPKDTPDSFREVLARTPALGGKPEYLQSPYVTPGNRAYMVGHQDGSFPPLGWHIKGEMGGIWAHPVKLMDGFEAALLLNDSLIPLNEARTFTNYPVANRHDYVLDWPALHISRWQFVPDDLPGVVIEYDIRNSGDSPLEMELMVTGMSDLRPTWLGERTGMLDGLDLRAYDPDLEAWVIRDSLNPWFVVFGPGDKTRIPADNLVRYSSAGAPGEPSLGSLSSVTRKISLSPGSNKSIRFVIAGSSRSEEEATVAYSRLLADATALLKAKRDRYAALATRSRLTTPDTLLNRTFEWLKYNSDWMIQDVPGIGSGITAGIPDYPWWFGVDSEYALRGYVAVGQYDAAFATIRLLDSISDAVNGNGRIVHEVSTNGAVFNPGNINETPQFATLIWDVYRWSGDRVFLERYFPTVRKGLDWLIRETDADGNGFPDGFGMMEIHGLDSEMIDVAAYTQAGFRDAAAMAAVLGEHQLAQSYSNRARELRERINREFWSEAFASFADFRGTDAQALRLIEDAIVRADTLGKPWAVAELEQTRSSIRSNPKPGIRPFVLHHNWVVNTPMEMGIADSSRAMRALETARKFTNPFGMFVTGIDRDASAGADASSFKGSKVFSYTGAVMTLPTGVQAVAENRYGHPDRALDYLLRMCRSFSFALPGSMYEVSPDYGMMAQAWNIYAFAVPIVEQFFGIDPMAADEQIRIHPSLPKAWEEASLENVRVGHNEVSVFFNRETDGRIHLRITQKEGWELEVPLSAEQAGEASFSEGEVLQAADGTFLLRTTARETTLSYPER